LVPVNNASDVIIASPYADDAVFGPFNMGINFPFFGSGNSTQANVSVNGNIQFGTFDSGIGFAFPNPSNRADPMIAPLFDDMALQNYDPLSRIRCNNSTPGQFVVIWDGVRRYGGPSHPQMTFEAILLGAGNGFAAPNGTIVFSYDSTGDQWVSSNPVVGLNKGDGIHDATLYPILGSPNGMLSATDGHSLANQAFTFTPNGAGGYSVSIGAPMPEPSTWLINTDGKWSTPGNWFGGVPNGPGLTARFIGATPAGGNVDSPVTVGRIFLDAGAAATNYTLSGATITLNNCGGTGAGSLIDVLTGNHAISAPVILMNDASITGNGILNLSGGVTGNYALSITGNVTATSIQVSTLNIGSMGALQAVPEPSTFTLLSIGAIGLPAYAWRRRKYGA
jgi:hypothetical protein